jgi:hypothetical protein
MTMRSPCCRLPGFAIPPCMNDFCTSHWTQPGWAAGD